MVASSTFFAVLAATASLVSATQQYDQQGKQDGKQEYGHDGGFDNKGYEEKHDMQFQQKDYSGDYYSAHTSYVKSIYHSSWQPSSKYATPSSKYAAPSSKYATPTSKLVTQSVKVIVPSKSASKESTYSVYYMPAPMRSSSASKAQVVSSKTYASYEVKSSAKSSASYAAPYIVSSVVSKRTATTSKFVDPFASSSKAANTFIAPVPYTPASSAAGSKITPAPSKGFSTVIAGNSTTKAPQTTLSLFNACSGTNATCATLKDLTYFASIVTANPTSTVFAIDCSKRGANGTQSCFNKAMTVTQGASLFARVDDSSSVPKTVSCNIISRTVSASCTETFRPTAVASTSPNNATVPGISFGFQSTQITYNPLVVTAGAEKLSASRTPVGPSSTASAAAASASGNAAGSLTAPAASFVGIGAVVFAVLAL